MKKLSFEQPVVKGDMDEQKKRGYKFSSIYYLQTSQRILKSSKMLSNHTEASPDQHEQQQIYNENDALHEDNYQKPQNFCLTLNGLKDEQMTQYQAEWIWSQFFEFLIYHIVYFIFLGPFMALFFWKYPGMTLLINMRFIKNHPQFYFQCLLWCGSVTGGLFYFVLENSVITLTEIMFMWFALLIRAVVIAAKYATLSPERIKAYKTRVLNEEFFNFDLMMWDWRIQSAKTLFIEPYRAIKRHDFEPSAFYFDFLVAPTKQTEDAIAQTDISFYEQYPVNESDLQPIIANSQYNGFHLFGYLVNQFQKYDQPYGFSIWVSAQSLILSCSPVLMRIDTIYNLQVSWLDIIRIVINILTSFQAFFGAFIFLHIGLYDFRRKIFLLDQCLYMLTSKRATYGKYKKLLPTINFNNPQTLQAWTMMRSIAFDYGQCFTLRVKGFYSLIFIGCILLFTLGMILILDMITLSIFQMVLLGEMSILLMGFTTYYLIMGAELNSYFQKFELLIEDVKSIYYDILRMKEQYFLFNLEPQNFKHKKFVKLLKQSFNCESEGCTKMEEFVNHIINELDENKRILDYDLKMSPFTLYGVVITYNLLKSSVVAVASLLGFVIQQRMSTPSCD